MDVTTLYCQTVESLQKSEEPWTEDQLLTCLVARDRIACLLKDSKLDDIQVIQQILVADNTFRELAPRMTKVKVFPRWRQSLNPSMDAWWWFPTSSGRWDRWDWLFSGLTLVFIALTLSFVTDIATRFYQEGLDLLGALTIVFPTLLASLSVGGVLSSTIQKGISLGLERLRIHPRYRHEVLFGLTVIVWLLVFGLWSNLPVISRYYNDKGVSNLLDKRQLASARRDFERAIKLDPANAVAHYNLGNVYEDLFDQKKAMTEYQIAAEAAVEELDLAYNNLGRLYILEGQYDEAARVLHKVLQIIRSKGKPNEEKVHYDVLKNLGWARVEQKRFRDARDLLNDAVQLLPERAPAHCLLGKVYAGLEDSSQAQAAWTRCISLAKIENPDEDRWIGEGRAYLRMLTTGETP